MVVRDHIGRRRDGLSSKSFMHIQSGIKVLESGSGHYLACTRTTQVLLNSAHLLLAKELDSAAFKYTPGGASNINIEFCRKGGTLQTLNIPRAQDHVNLYAIHKLFFGCFFFLNIIGCSA